MSLLLLPLLICDTRAHDSLIELREGSSIADGIVMSLLLLPLLICDTRAHDCLFKSREGSSIADGIVMLLLLLPLLICDASIVFGGCVVVSARRTRICIVRHFEFFFGKFYCAHRLRYA